METTRADIIFMGKLERSAWEVTNGNGREWLVEWLRGKRGSCRERTVENLLTRSEKDETTSGERDVHMSTVSGK